MAVLFVIKAQAANKNLCYCVTAYTRTVLSTKATDPFHSQHAPLRTLADAPSSRGKKGCQDFQQGL